MQTQHHRRARLAVAALFAAIVSVLLAVTPASATPPGKNGLISFRRYFNADHTNGALFVINPDGTHETPHVPGLG